MDSAGLYRAVFESAPVAIAVLDPDTLVRGANAQLALLLSRDLASLRSLAVGDLAVSEDAARLTGAVREAQLAGDRSVVVEHRYRNPDGEGWSRTAVRSLAGGDHPGWTVCTFHDLTRDQQALEQHRREAEQDALTGLLNRRGGDRRLTAALQRMVLAGPVAVIICDADRLKQINDRYGHAAGDEALVDLARCLRAAVRSGDDVARMGGDEFIVVARVAGADEARSIAERCVRATAAAGEDRPDRCRVTISAGVALASPGEPVDPTGLLAEADRALYEAKRRGGNRWHVCDRPRPGGR